MNSSYISLGSSYFVHSYVASYSPFKAHLILPNVEQVQGKVEHASNN